MTFAQILSLVLLGVCLVLAVWRRINIGILALASALIILELTGTDPKVMYKTFPASVFTLIVGVSLLFGHLEKSGALDAFVTWVFNKVGNRTWLLPWACFVIAAGLSSMGAFSTAPIALLVPVVAFVSAKYPRYFFINEMAVVIGANAAGLSPLNPTGATVHTALAKTNVTYSTWGLWAISMVVTIVVIALIQVLELARQRRGGEPLVPMVDAGNGEGRTAHPLNRPYAICSGLVLLAFVVLSAFFKFDIGVTAMFGVLLLQVAFRPNEKEIISRVPWNAVLLLCGLLTYLGLIDAIGTMDQIQEGLTHVGSAGLLILVIAYVAALLCNIESSTLGVLTLMAPILGATVGGEHGVLLAIAAMAVPAALTVMNPVHVAGTLVVGNTVEKQQSAAFGRLFGLSVILSLVFPGLLSLVAIAAR